MREKLVASQGSAAVEGAGRLSRWASWIAIGMGCLVLLGWGFDIPALKQGFSGMATMKVNTAIALIASGISLWLLRVKLSAGVKPGQTSALIWGAALLVLMIGLCTLSEYLFGWDLKIDHLFFQDDLTAMTLPSRRMGINTAFSLVLIGGALLLSLAPQGILLAQGLMLLLVLLVLQVIVGHVYRIAMLEQSNSGMISMALHTALALMSTGIGILALHPQKGLLQTLTSDLEGSYMVRRFLPAAIALPLLLGWVIVQGYRANLYEPTFGITLLVVLLIIVYVVLIWQNGSLLNRNDLKRRQAELLQQQIEADLRTSEARFKRLVDSNIIGILFADLSGRITEANDAFLNLMGYSREDVTAGRLRWDKMTPSDYAAQDQRSLESLRQTGASSPYEKEYVHQKGYRIPVLVGTALLPNSHEDCIAYVLDLSDRKRSEAALRESEARFRYMTDTAPMMVWMSGLDQQCDYFNQSWLKFRGRTLEQEFGNGWMEGIHPEDADYCLQIYTTHFDARQPFEMEYRLKRFDGEYRWILDLGIPRFTLEGEFLGYIGSCFDIHDRKQAEAEMRQLNELLEQRVKERTTELESANRELEAFSYSVSHDLRAPLRQIAGFVELLNKRASTTELDAVSRRYLQIITDTTKQAGNLIDDLLDFSRMGRTEMRWMMLDLNQLVREVKRDIKSETAGRNIRWQIDSLPIVQGDPAMLRQVIRNLIENSVKYTRSQPQAAIHIGSIQREQEDVIFVRDNGIGFNMQYAHKLFGIFQRLHSDPQFEGTGIGLATIRRIIHRHGGQVWAEGTVNGGATFYFSLPKLSESGNDTAKAHSTR